MGYDITKIPDLMRSRGWEKGAALMDGWFARPANERPESVTPDKTTITMRWALGFERARSVFDTMVAERVWMNPAGQREIKNMLESRGLLTRQELCFGDLVGDVQAMDRHYVQYRTVGTGLFDAADDMLAALGNFAFRVVVSGEITPRAGRHRVQLRQIGIYIRDSYDFIGDQSLGYWSDAGFAGGFNPIGGTQVTNADFRAYRTAHGRGGDYLVFSDVRIILGGDRDVLDI